MKPSPNRDRAADLLTHYFRVCLERAGYPLDADARAEIRECVDALIDPALEEAAWERKEALGA